MKKKKLKKFFEIYMSCIGPLGNLMFFFQAFNIFSEKNSGAVSLPGFSISVIAMSGWLAYGLFMKNKPLIIANAVGALGALAVVVGIMIYPAAS